MEHLLLTLLGVLLGCSLALLALCFGLVLLLVWLLRRTQMRDVFIYCVDPLIKSARISFNMSNSTAPVVPTPMSLPRDGYRALGVLGLAAGTAGIVGGLWCLNKGGVTLP